MHEQAIHVWIHVHLQVSLHVHVPDCSLFWCHYCCWFVLAWVPNSIWYMYILFCFHVFWEKKSIVKLSMTTVFSRGFWKGQGVFWLRFLILLEQWKKISLLWQAFFLFHATWVDCLSFPLWVVILLKMSALGFQFLLLVSSLKGPYVCPSVNFKMAAVRWNECITG